jgi:Zn-dependent protease with chaperone function
MNFFAEQERARRNTWVLVGLMAAAVLCLILMTALAIGLVLHFFTQQPLDSPALAVKMQVPWHEMVSRLLHSDVLYYSAVAVLATVLGGSLFKFFQLGGNGRRVAEALGGRMILPNTNDAMERKILNIVEEMAIASGNPVPPVYLLDEPGINAFAAGTDRRNAVIGVTRGCIELLNRDELQGVVAHEFSHIHNGDMRLNMRLVAVLHGILLIGLIGSMMLRSAGRHNRKNQNAQLGMGLALVVLGYCGVFFGNLIKAAVSRQREFLADASAVQFTRNPSGIANALKKIGGHSEHALLHNPRAAEFSHMYFSQGITSALGMMMATHPPLAQRIRKIQPRWDGTMITPQRVAAHEPESTTAGGKKSAMAAGLAMMAAVDQVGATTPEQIEDAHVFIKGLPERIHAAAHEPFNCRALIYWLLLDRRNPQALQKQWQLLREFQDSATLNAMEELRGDMASLERADNLRIIDLCLPALKTLSQSQYQAFKKDLLRLIKADDEVSLFEWCLYRIVTSSYEEKVSSGNKRLGQVQDAIQVLLTAACRDLSDAAFIGALAAAERHLKGVSLQKEINRSFSIAALDSAIKELEQLRPLDKPVLLKALAAAIEADGKVTEEETELFRAIADCLDCPVPPLHSGN